MIWEEILSHFDVALDKEHQKASMRACLDGLSARSDVNAKLLSWAEGYFSVDLINTRMTEEKWAEFKSQWLRFVDLVSGSLQFLVQGPTAAEMNVFNSASSGYLSKCIEIMVQMDDMGIEKNIQVQLLSRLHLAQAIIAEIPLFMSFTREEFFTGVDDFNRLMAKILTTAIYMKTANNAKLFEILLKRFAALQTTKTPLKTWDESRLAHDPVKYMLHEVADLPLTQTLSKFSDETRAIIAKFRAVLPGHQQTQMSNLAVQYEKVLAYQFEYQHYSLFELGLRARKLGEGMREIPIDQFWDEEAALRLLAIIRVSMAKYCKKLPYDTQMLAMMATLNPAKDYRGRIAQVSTGEGKSMINAMMIAFMACQGRFVDVITSNESLAKRDHHAYQDYLKIFDIDSAVICHEGGFDLEAINTARSKFKSQVLFGRNSDFEFALMFDAIEDLNIRGARPSDVVLVDEIDNLLIDMSGNASRLAKTSIKDISWMYKPLWDFCTGSGVFVAHPYAAIRAHLLSAAKTDFCKQQLLMLTDQGLWVLVAAVRSAFVKERNIDYIIKAGETLVEIIDRINGVPMPGSRWTDVHEFVEVKEGLVPRAASDVLAQFPHSVFFEKYRNIFGLTGTVGEEIEQEEVKDIYRLDTFNVPRHKPNLKVSIDPRVHGDQESYYLDVQTAILEMQAKGRPVLVLFDSILASQRFFNAEITVPGGRKEHWMLLNSQQDANTELKILASAGMSKRVTISTNMSGRGTDIILGGSVEAHIESLQENLDAVLGAIDGLPESVADTDSPIESNGLLRSAGKFEALLKHIHVSAMTIKAILGIDVALSGSWNNVAKILSENVAAAIRTIKEQWLSSHKQVVDAGGLHVILAFFPESQREHVQAFGRSARQGQPGSCQLILHAKRHVATVSQYIATLERQRSYNTSLHSQRRRLLSLEQRAIDQVCMQRIFLAMPQIRVVLRNEIMTADFGLFSQASHYLNAITNPRVAEHIRDLARYELAPLDLVSRHKYIDDYLRLLLQRWAEWFGQLNRHRHYSAVTLFKFLNYFLSGQAAFELTMKSVVRDKVAQREWIRAEQHYETWCGYQKEYALWLSNTQSSRQKMVAYTRAEESYRQKRKTVAAAFLAARQYESELEAYNTQKLEHDIYVDVLAHLKGCEAKLYDLRLGQSTRIIQVISERTELGSSIDTARREIAGLKTCVREADAKLQVLKNMSARTRFSDLSVAAKSMVDTNTDQLRLSKTAKEVGEMFSDTLLAELVREMEL